MLLNDRTLFNKNFATTSSVLPVVTHVYFSGNSVPFVRHYLHSSDNFLGQASINKPVSPENKKAVLEIGTADLKLVVKDQQGIHFYTYPSHIGQAIAQGNGLEKKVIDAFIAGVRALLNVLQQSNIKYSSNVPIMAGSAFHDAVRRSKLASLLKSQGFTQEVFVPDVVQRNQMNYAGVLGGNIIPARPKMMVISIGGNGADICYGKFKNYVSSSHLPFGVEALQNPYDPNQLLAFRLKVRRSLSHIISSDQKNSFSNLNAVYLHPRELDFLWQRILGQSAQNLISAKPFNLETINNWLGLEQENTVNEKALLRLKQSIDHIAIDKSQAYTGPEKDKIYRSTLSLGEYVVRYYTIVSEIMRALNLEQVRYGASGGPLANLLA